MVAQRLRDVRLGTLLLDRLTTKTEAAVDMDADLHLLTRRLIMATTWLQAQPHTQRLGIGYCGANTGAAVALQAAAALGPSIRALVSYGGCPHVARGVLPHVQTPTLLIVGTHDPTILELNQEAYDTLPDPKHLAIVPGATHDFEGPGALQEVAHLAAAWFRRYLDIESL
jgi:dienelactone hydrolase